MRNLDLDQLRTFAVAAQLKSFTAAGVSLGATQSAVSVRIAKLEEQIGRPLLARTPRSVALTPDGVLFLDHVRTILAAHDAALAQLAAANERSILRLLVSDHAAGARLTTALASLKLSLPLMTPEVIVGLSSELRPIYDAGEADAAILRQEGGRRDGTPLFDDPLAWAADVSFRWSPGDVLPLIALRADCGVKAASIRALDEARIVWRFSFLGGSVAAIQAAVQAGLGVAAFGARHIPSGCKAVTRAALPPLPDGSVVLHSRLAGTSRRALIAAFAAP